MEESVETAIQPASQAGRHPTTKITTTITRKTVWIYYFILFRIARTYIKHISFVSFALSKFAVFFPCSFGLYVWLSPFCWLLMLFVVVYCISCWVLATTGVGGFIITQIEVFNQKIFGWHDAEFYECLAIVSQIYFIWSLAHFAWAYKLFVKFGVRRIVRWEGICFHCDENKIESIYLHRPHSRIAFG